MKKILGSMTFGDRVSQAEAEAIIAAFLDSGSREIDTANAYCDGATESMLGSILPAQKTPVYLASKVNPWNDEGLQPQQVRQQLAQSLQRVGIVRSMDKNFVTSPRHATRERAERMLQRSPSWVLVSDREKPAALLLAADLALFLEDHADECGVMTDFDQFEANRF